MEEEGSNEGWDAEVAEEVNFSIKLDRTENQTSVQPKGGFRLKGFTCSTNREDPFV
jgi:hypothetical protein